MQQLSVSLYVCFFFCLLLISSESLIFADGAPPSPAAASSLSCPFANATTFQKNATVCVGVYYVSLLLDFVEWSWFGGDSAPGRSMGSTGGAFRVPRRWYGAALMSDAAIVRTRQHSWPIVQRLCATSLAANSGAPPVLTEVGSFLHYVDRMDGLLNRAQDDPLTPKLLSNGSMPTQVGRTPVANVCQSLTASTDVLQRAAQGSLTVDEASTLQAVPGIQLVPFMTTGGFVLANQDLVQPASQLSRSGSTTVGAAASLTYRVTVAIIGTTTAVETVVEQWNSARTPTSVATPEPAQQQRFVLRQLIGDPDGAVWIDRRSLMYRTLGLIRATVLPTAEYLLLYPGASRRDVGTMQGELALGPLRSAAGMSTSSLLYPSVGYGALSDLSAPWIVLLVVATVLVAAVVYIFVVRRLTSTTNEDNEGAAREERALEDEELEDLDDESYDPLGSHAIHHDASTGTPQRAASANVVSVKGGTSPQSEEAQEVPSSEDEEEKARLHAQATNTGSAELWNERDLEGELRRLVDRKLRAEKQLLEKPQEGTEGEEWVSAASRRNQRRTAKRSNRPGALPQSSLFEEALATAPMFMLPPETEDQDPSLFEKRLRRLQQADEQRRARLRRSEVLGPNGLPKSNDEEEDHGDHSSGRSDDDDNAQGGDDDEQAEQYNDELGISVRAVDALAALEQGNLERQQQEHKGVFAETLAHRLAARRMASMMTLSNIRFAAVPQGAHWIPQKHELNAGLSGGSVNSHLRMAGEHDDTAERIARAARKGGSKLFFAPQSLVEQQQLGAADSDNSDSEGYSPARRFAEIARNVNPINHQEPSPPNSMNQVEL